MLGAIYNFVSDQFSGFQALVVPGTLRDYGVLNDLAPARIRSDLIQRHWEDMLRVAGSWKWGTVNATALIQTFQYGYRPTVLGRAIGEAGSLKRGIF